MEIPLNYLMFIVMFYLAVTNEFIQFISTKDGLYLRLMQKSTDIYMEDDEQKYSESKLYRVILLIPYRQR